MTFALDARAAFVDPHRGFGRMVRELVPALMAQATDQLVLCVPAHAPCPPAWYLRAGKVLKLRRPPRGAWLFDGPAWAWSARRCRFSCLHLPAWGVPPGVPVPVVATFHDATPLLFPTGLSWWQRLRVRQAVYSLRRATLVHTPSGFAKKQLAALLPQLEQHTTVIPHGVASRFAPVANPTQDYLLGVGGGEQHKNWQLLLELYTLPQASALPRLRLVGAVARQPSLRQWIAGRGLAGRVELLPEVDEETLLRLYQNALALVFPSRNEGFGLPALEAMACGCPVVAAQAGALPEVCGEAALLLSPQEPSAWLETLLALQANPQLRHSLRQRGLQRARSFTWERTAQGLLELYGEAARRASSQR